MGLDKHLEAAARRPQQCRRGTADASRTVLLAGGNTGDVKTGDLDTGGMTGSSDASPVTRWECQVNTAWKNRSAHVH